MNRVASVAALVAGLYVSVCAAAIHFQRDLLYFPQPSSLGASDQTVTVRDDGDAKVVASFQPRAGSKAVVYLGGNADDVTRSIDTLRAAFPDRTLYLLHYRGYGASTGTPSEEALLSDALALFDLAAQTHSEVQVVGRSLGSGLAIHVASQRPVARLVLITPYDSVLEIAASRFWFLPVRWFLWDKYESGKYAPLIAAPTLLLAADHDNVVPLASTARLATRFKTGVAALKILPDCGHNSIAARPEYAALLGGSQL